MLTTFKSPRQTSDRLASASNFETVYRFESCYGNTENVDGNATQALSVNKTSQLTEDIQILSSAHGRARRHLREVPKL